MLVVLVHTEEPEEQNEDDIVNEIEVRLAQTLKSPFVQEGDHGGRPYLQREAEDENEDDAEDE